MATVTPFFVRRSRRNNADIYRRVLVNHYMNAWSLLPWHDDDENRTPVPKLDARMIVPVAGRAPYAWKGYEKPHNNVWLRTCKANAPA